VKPYKCSIHGLIDPVDVHKKRIKRGRKKGRTERSCKVCRRIRKRGLSKSERRSLVEEDEAYRKAEKEGELPIYECRACGLPKTKKEMIPSKTLQVGSTCLDCVRDWKLELGLA